MVIGINGLIGQPVPERVEEVSRLEWDTVLILGKEKNLQVVFIVRHELRFDHQTIYGSCHIIW